MVILHLLWPKSTGYETAGNMNILQGEEAIVYYNCDFFFFDIAN